MTMGPAPSAPAAQPRTVEGPIQSEFQRQEARLVTLETTMQELRARQDEQASSQQACMQLIEKKDQDMKQLVTTSVQAAKQEIESSLAKALSQHTQHLDTNLADLKSMLKARKSKRGRGKEHEDMETDDES